MSLCFQEKKISEWRILWRKQIFSTALLAFDGHHQDTAHALNLQLVAISKRHSEETKPKVKFNSDDMRQVTYV